MPARSHGGGGGRPSSTARRPGSPRQVVRRMPTGSRGPVRGIRVVRGEGPMSRRARLVAAALAGAVLAGVLLWSRREPAGFASPAACVEAYRDACLAGDVAAYLDCLAEPLCSQRRPTARPDDLKRELDRVVGWAQHEPVAEGDEAHVDVDLTRREGTQRVRFRLRRAGGWLIASVEAPRPVPAVIPHGTHVSEAPEGPAPRRP